MTDADERPMIPDMCDGLWVTSDPLDDGRYVAVISVDGDRSYPLSRFKARRYAFAALQAGLAAEFEEAMYRQLTDNYGIDEETVLAMVARHRQQRAGTDDAATAPIRFVPGFSGASHKGFVVVELDGQPYAQLDCRGTIRHAQMVLIIEACCELDATYRRLLINDVGLTDELAQAAVTALAHDQAVTGE